MSRRTDRLPHCVVCGLRIEVRGAIAGTDATKWEWQHLFTTAGREADRDHEARLKR